MIYKVLTRRIVVFDRPRGRCGAAAWLVDSGENSASLPLLAIMSFLKKITAAASLLVLSLAPLCSWAAGDEPIAISANDQMKFDTTDIAGKTGQKLTIVLTNDGSLPKAAMAHNIVVLQPGTDVPAFVAAASKRGANDYIPGDDQASRMIVHTKLLGPGEDDTISFTPSAPGVYEYVCTFPAHAMAGMRGKITVQ